MLGTGLFQLRYDETSVEVGTEQTVCEIDEPSMRYKNLGQGLKGSIIPPINEHFSHADDGGMGKSQY